MKGNEMGILSAQCVECERVFDLTDDNDVEEWHYGHDCEAK